MENSFPLHTHDADTHTKTHPPKRVHNPCDERTNGMKRKTAQAGRVRQPQKLKVFDGDDIKTGYYQSFRDIQRDCITSGSTENLV